jgi:cell division protein FtsB
MPDKNKKREKKNIRNKIRTIKNAVFWFFAAIVFLSILGYSVITNIKIGNVRTQYLDRIDALQKQIKDAEDRKALLEKGLSQVGQKDYLEEIARKQFGLKAPGEEVTVVVKDQQNQDNNAETGNNISSKDSPWNLRTWWRWITGK